MQNRSIFKNLRASSSLHSSFITSNCTIKANGEIRYHTAKEKFISLMDITSKVILTKERRNPVMGYLFSMMDLITEEMLSIQSSQEKAYLCQTQE